MGGHLTVLKRGALSVRAATPGAGWCRIVAPTLNGKTSEDEPKRSRPRIRGYYYLPPRWDNLPPIRRTPAHFVLDRLEAPARNQPAVGRGYGG